jgi:hypothetical protein
LGFPRGGTGADAVGIRVVTRTQVYDPSTAWMYRRLEQSERLDRECCRSPGQKAARMANVAGQSDDRSAKPRAAPWGEARPAGYGEVHGRFGARAPEILAEDRLGQIVGHSSEVHNPERAKQKR